MQFSAQWRVFEGITYTSHKIASASAELENTLDSMGWLRGSSFGQGLGPGSIDDFMVDQIFEGLKTALGTLYEAVAETAQMLPLLEPFATQVAADCEHTPPETETSETSFSSLPVDVQQKIVTMHLAAQRRTPPYTCYIPNPGHTNGGARTTCRAWEALDFLAGRARQHLLVHTPQLAAHLPYAPLLKSIKWTEIPTRFLWSVLALNGSPHLASISLESVHMQDLPANLAAVSGNTQLTHFFIDLEEETLDDPEAPPRRPIPELPALPSLRSLGVNQPLLGRGPRSALPIGLGNLSAMQQLTSLSLSPEEYYECLDSDAIDTSAAMRPVCEALGKLLNLRIIHIWCWTCGPSKGAHACWQSFSRSLRNLIHLTSLQLRSLLLPPGFCGSHFTALASALPRLAALRSLVLNGRDKYDEDEGSEFEGGDVDKQPDDVSGLVRAIGTLTNLTHLELTDLQCMVSARDCDRHLRCLSELRWLVLSCGAPAVPPEELPADGGIHLLSGMSQLTRLSLAQFEPCGEGSAQRLCDAICALPQLGALDRCSCVDLTMLAERIGSGYLPQLRSSAGVYRKCEELNELAGRSVFARYY